MDKQDSGAQPRNVAENQASTAGIVRTRGYTGKFASLIIAGLGMFVLGDLSAKGGRQISIYFGVSSRTWTWFWLISGIVLSWWLASRVSLNSYLMRAVKEHNDPDPVDPIEAGVLDVPIWSSLLACVTTVLVFAFVPAWFGTFRPVLIVLIAIVLSASFSFVLTGRIVKALYGPARVRKTISRTQCEMVFAKGARCANWALRSRFRRARAKDDKRPHEFCRWHLVAAITATRHAKKPRASVNKQYLAAICLAIGTFGFWNALHAHALVWSMIFVFCLGATFRYIAESIIVPWIALSKLAFWSKLFTFGLGFQIVAGIALLVVAGKWPENLQPLVNLAPAAKLWLAFGPIVLYLLVTLLTAFAVDVLSSRILFFGPTSFASLFALATFLPIWRMSTFAVSQYQPFRDWIGEDFWKQIIGGRVRTIQALAFFAGMAPAFVLLRNREQSNRAASVNYVNTMAQILLPAAVSFLSMLLSRYFLLAAGVKGSPWFIGVTFALSLTLSFLLLPLVNTYRNRARARSLSVDQNGAKDLTQSIP